MLGESDFLQALTGPDIHVCASAAMGPVCSDTRGLSLSSAVYRRDNVEWDAEQEEAALKAIERQEQSPISPEEQGEAQRSARAFNRFLLTLGLPARSAHADSKAERDSCKILGLFLPERVGRRPFYHSTRAQGRAVLTLRMHSTGKTSFSRIGHGCVRSLMHWQMRSSQG